jgi:small subunit ribosomal protein S6
MFVFDPTFATDSKNVDAEIERIMQRAGAEVIVSGKWEERKLAFEIKRRKRGCYVLTYFKADPTSIGAIERDCALSEDILRVLILQADDVSRARMESMYPKQQAAAPESAPESPKPAPEDAKKLEPAGVAASAEAGASEDKGGGEESSGDSN